MPAQRINPIGNEWNPPAARFGRVSAPPAPAPAPAPALRISNANLMQAGDGLTEPQLAKRAEIAPYYSLNAFGSTIYSSSVSQAPYGRDYLITTDGSPEYTSRLAGEVSWKVKLSGDSGSNFQAGLLILENLGKNCAFYAEDLSGIITSREYSYGSLAYDGVPEGQSDTATIPGTRLRVGVDLKFGFYLSGTVYAQVNGYAQEVIDTFSSLGPIPGYPGEFAYLTSPNANETVPFPVECYTPGTEANAFIESYYVEFTVNTATKAVECWGIDPVTHARVGNIYPSLFSAGFVAEVESIINSYMTVDTPVAGAIRTLSSVSNFGFECLNAI